MSIRSVSNLFLIRLLKHPQSRAGFRIPHKYLDGSSECVCGVKCKCPTIASRRTSNLRRVTGELAALDPTAGNQRFARERVFTRVYGNRQGWLQEVRDRCFFMNLKARIYHTLPDALQPVAESVYNAVIGNLAAAYIKLHPEKKERNNIITNLSTSSFPRRRNTVSSYRNLRAKTSMKSETTLSNNFSK